MAVIKIAPSLLNADFSRLAEAVVAAQKGGADWLHLDIMDGHFVPNITFGPIIVAAARKLTQLDLDVHLMISDADAYLPAFRQAGADHITVHVEACPHLWRTLEQIRHLGAHCGVTLNPATPLDVLDPVLDIVDMVLIMSVEPGFGGQKFIAKSVERIARLAQWRRERKLDFLIQVDGGIDSETAPLVVRAGADVLVVGQAIFGQPDPERMVREIRRHASA
jgi:ribulose-phosphate 3-epimerase